MSSVVPGACGKAKNEIIPDDPAEAPQCCVTRCQNQSTPTAHCLAGSGMCSSYGIEERRWETAALYLETAALKDTKGFCKSSSAISGFSF